MPTTEPTTKPSLTRVPCLRVQNSMWGCAGQCIASLSSYLNRPLEAIVDYYAYSRWKDGVYGVVPFAFFMQGGGDESNYGDQFKEFILANSLGQVVDAGKNYNPNHGIYQVNAVTPPYTYLNKAFIWVIDNDALDTFVRASWTKEHYEREVNRLRHANKYYA